LLNRRYASERARAIVICLGVLEIEVSTDLETALRDFEFRDITFLRRQVEAMPMREKAHWEQDRCGSGVIDETGLWHIESPCG
jgi:hypothetical protein